MKLRLKILGGFLTLAFMLLIATSWSVIEVQSFGSTMNDLIENNYKSITAAKTMKAALEREDSALLLLQLGKQERGSKLLAGSDSIFTANYKIAESNITIDGEAEIVKAIADKYSKYKQQWKIPASQTLKENKLDWYFQNAHESFLGLMNDIDELSGLNDSKLYTTAIQVSEKSRRAIMPGIVALIAMIVFTLLFNFFINLYIVTPILEITKRLDKFIMNRTPFEYHVNTKDEMSQLTETLNTFCTHIEADETGK